MIQLPKIKRDPKEIEDLCKYEYVTHYYRRRVGSKCSEICWESELFLDWSFSYKYTQDITAITDNQCRPVCHSRRRQWKGQLQNTSAELLLETKPIHECFRRYPTKVYSNSPCPLFARTRKVTLEERGVIPEPRVVRICQAPIDDSVKTPYLEYVRLAQHLGAWGSVRACCAFCSCGGCCPCQRDGYCPRDAERATCRREDMRGFDARVRHDCGAMRIMYHDY